MLADLTTKICLEEYDFGERWKKSQHIDENKAHKEQRQMRMYEGFVTKSNGLLNY